MAFFTPEMQRLQDKYMETMKNRDDLRDMLVTAGSPEHAINGFPHDLERFAKLVEGAYAIVNQIDLDLDATYELQTIQEVNRSIHYANTTLKAILAKYSEMKNAMCHKNLLDAKKEKALPNLCPADYLILRDLIVALHTEFDASHDSVYLSTWKAILLLKCLGYKESSQQLIHLIETSISRSESGQSDGRQVPLLKLMHFINVKRRRFDSHFACLQEAKSHCSVVDDAVRLSVAKRLLVQYVPDLPTSNLASLVRQHDYSKTNRLSFLQFALMVGPLIKQMDQAEDEADSQEDEEGKEEREGEDEEEDAEHEQKRRQNTEDNEDNDMVSLHACKRETRRGVAAGTAARPSRTTTPPNDD